VRVYKMGVARKSERKKWCVCVMGVGGERERVRTPKLNLSLVHVKDLDSS